MESLKYDNKSLDGPNSSVLALQILLMTCNQVQRLYREQPKYRKQHRSLDVQIAF